MQASLHRISPTLWDSVGTQARERVKRLGLGRPATAHDIPYPTTHLAEREGFESYSATRETPCAYSDLASAAAQKRPETTAVRGR